jgi:hypothetical protein
MHLLVLPAEIARYIYLHLYFPWVVKELKVHCAEDNQFVISDRVVEIDSRRYQLFLLPAMTLELYRKGISSHPTDILQAWLDHLSN